MPDPYYDDWDEYCELEQQEINEDSHVGEFSLEDALEAMR
jgi:asparagine synthetase A